jgi:hypothetical protein
MDDHKDPVAAAQAMEALVARLTAEREAELKVRKMKRYGSAKPTKAETAQREKDLADAASLQRYADVMRGMEKDHPARRDEQACKDIAVVERVLRQRASELRKGSRS